MALLEKDCQEILELALLDIENFYKNDLLVFKGKTKDSGLNYNEYAASFVCDNLSAFHQVIVPNKTTPYVGRMLKHYDINQTNVHTCKRVSLALYEQSVFECGKITECQLPLYDAVTPKTLDRIDAVLHTPKQELFLLNLKPKYSEQSMLRIIVEAMIIYQKTKLSELTKALRLNKHTKVKFAPLIFKDSYAHRQLSESRPELFKLIHALELDIFVVEYVGDKLTMSRLNYTEIDRSKLVLMEKQA